MNYYKSVCVRERESEQERESKRERGREREWFRKADRQEDDCEQAVPIVKSSSHVC